MKGSTWTSILPTGFSASMHSAKQIRADDPFCARSFRGEQCSWMSGRTSVSIPARWRPIGSRGHVFAFEPVEENLEALHRNVALNRLGNVSILPVALSDREEHLEMYAPPGHRGGSSANISAKDPGAGVPMGSTNAVRLDDVFEGSRLDAIELDVEGYKPEVLRGAAATLHRFRPIILCEVNFPDVLEVILDLGRDLRLTPWVESHGRLAPFRREVWTNDLFLLPEESRR